MSHIRQSGTIRFGIFEVDLRSGELRKKGIRIRLHHQPFQLLTLLIEHAGDVVPREELKNKLWGSETFVDFDVGLNSAIKKLRDALGDSADVPRYIETIPRKGYRFIEPLTELPSSNAVRELPRLRPRWRWLLPGSAAAIGALLLFLGKPPSAQIRSIAVLPFENLTGDPAQEYIADGLTDALTTELAQISALRVISRTSAVRYKRTKERLSDIAKELNVDAIVEGTFTRSAGRVRVDAQLIQAATDRHLWAHTYERSLGDVVSVQTEVAQAIADAIQIQLTPREHTHLARRQTVDPQAYESYLRGRFFLDKWSDPASRKSIAYFQEAIQRDNKYALAYAGLAEAYIGREDLSPRDAYSKSKAMAHLALDMDPGLAEAHNMLAMSLFHYDWNWSEAEKEFQRALEINPNYAMAHQFYGQFQKAMGRKNWTAEVQRAHALDPLSVIIAGAGQYRVTGRFDLAIENLHKKLEIDPTVPGVYSQLGDVYVHLRRYEDAVTNFQKAFEFSEEAPAYLGRLGYTYGLAGRRIEALQILEQLAQLSKRKYVSPFDVALVYVGMGEKDAAFHWLDKALAEHSPQLVFLNWDYKMASLRSDPRYTELLHRVGLPDRPNGDSYRPSKPSVGGNRS